MLVSLYLVCFGCTEPSEVIPTLYGFNNIVESVPWQDFDSFFGHDLGSQCLRFSSRHIPRKMFMCTFSSFLKLCVYMCIWVWVCTHECSILGDQKRVWGHLELVLQAGISCTVSLFELNSDLLEEK